MSSINSTFEVGKKYGNDFTVTILKRTAKTITFESTFGVNRVKLRGFDNAAGGFTEQISFKAWIVDAAEPFDKEEAKRISYEKAYYY